ncbi:receptor-like protein kinase 4 [Artemisia annua]|uniref:Receptor-like serine/threonine-protein kinase n=1 Tax=Artemisia annua TaxID=35608 RepID=A0A2U1KKC2_ARTAN|nr:receptor-like protein kinase 4 [Artemisia annua]
MSPIITTIFLILATSFHPSTPCLDPNTSKLILTNTTSLSSPNNTFKLSFFTTKHSKSYLAISYSSIQTPTYIWVANRQSPLTQTPDQSFLFISNNSLTLTQYENDKCDVVWTSSSFFNPGIKDTKLTLLENGNLVVTDGENESGVVIWQSFDDPTDTFLPGMNLTVGQTLTCWKSQNDPSMGKYSLRLRPPDYGEVELLFTDGEEKSYWSTGNWTGNIFANVPEMTLPYIYKFYFENPFTKTASFGFTENMVGQTKPLTRFTVDFSGQVKQFTWSTQTESWNMFWSQPESKCRVYGVCGDLGFCKSGVNVGYCECLDGFEVVDGDGWVAGDYSGGCRREGCGKGDEFEVVGDVTFDYEKMGTFSGVGRSECERRCLGDCACVGISYNVKTSSCKNYFGKILNMGNSSSDIGISQEFLSVRVSRGVNGKKIGGKVVVLISVVSCLVAVLLLAVVGLVFYRKKMVRRKKLEEESVFPVTNLKVFTYKELETATNGFSDQLGHGGFGAVFSGNVDSTLVAVKRLDRPGGGEKEFRAEVCTIGNIQHVNLVRLRGFCSEESHRLLVYDYMPNGPLSSYLKTGGRNLDWDARFRIAIGTARGIAYLHEECRNCILHCDIKPENILLDEDYSAKVSDFGLAKLIGRDFSRVLATMRGTWGYVAPEWISGVAITTKADVYSYGMTLLELLGGRRNVEGPPDGGNGGESNDKWFFPPWAARRISEGDVAAVVDERLGGEYNMEEVVRVGLVAVWCIQDEEVSRPTMGMVVKMLEGVVEVEVPPPPKLLQALVSGESFHGVGGNSRNDTLSHVSVDSKDSQFAI